MTVLFYLLVSPEGYVTDILCFDPTAHITPGLPGFDLPAISTKVNGETLQLYQMIQHLGGGLVVIPMVQIISSVAIAKAFCKLLSSVLEFGVISKQCFTRNDITAT